MKRSIAVLVPLALAAALAACGGGDGGGGGSVDAGASGPSATPADAFVSSVQTVVDQGPVETTEPQDTSAVTPTTDDTSEPVAVAGAAG
jgi:hypothetical protein